MPAIIYLVTNTLDGKQYVGFTTNLTQRIRNHRLALKRGHFHSAIRKHGWDNFAVDVIFEHDDEQWTLNVMEPHFIAWYDTYENGYNLTKGGEGTLGAPSWAKGKKLGPLSEERKRNISKAKMGTPSPRKGTGKPKPPPSRKQYQPVRVTDTHTGEVVTYPSLKDAALALGCANGTLCTASKNNGLIAKRYRLERL